jgi:patatin-like phospholipase/acyl hydrolase
MTIAQRIRRPGPKKILALDGGGILGLMSVEILARIEDELRRRFAPTPVSRSGTPGFVLADYFDFVCGTSTGAVIASCIASGMPMAQIRAFYLDSGKEMFDPASLLSRLHYRYEDEPIARKLRTELAKALGDDATLGSPGLRCLLMMVMRNASTDSPWPVSNNPFAKYNDRARADCNLDIPLWQLVRASTAAPTYFPPEVVRVGSKTFVFVDGGVTTYNNPAFLAFLMATAAPYRVGWETGEDKMLIVSIGTGSAPRENAALKPSDLHLLYNAASIPAALMNAASAGQDLACRVLGKCLHGEPIDREVGDLVQQQAPTSSAPKQFTYVRYDPPVTRAGLDALGLRDVDPAHVQTLDSVAYIPEIQRVGHAYAAQHVRAEHFVRF